MLKTCQNQCLATFNAESCDFSFLDVIPHSMQDVTEHTHSHTHACVRVSTRHRSQGQPVSVRRHRQLVKVTTSAAPKKQGKTAILSFTLHFYSATFCTFTARPPKKRSNTKNIALLQRFAMQVTVPRLTKAPDSASPCLR